MLSSRSGGTKGSVNKAGEWGVVGFDVGILDDRKPALVRASSKRNLGLCLCAYWWRGWASLRRERSGHRSGDRRGCWAIHDVFQRRSGLLGRRWRGLGAAEVRRLGYDRGTTRGGLCAAQAWCPTMSCRGWSSARGPRRDASGSLHRRKRGSRGGRGVPCLRRRRRCARRGRGGRCWECRGSREGRGARERGSSQTFDFGLELGAFELLFAILLLLATNFSLKRCLALLEF
jgi:hypothetical protein